MKRVLDRASALAVILGALWLSLSSSLFLTVHEVRYDYRTERISVLRDVRSDQVVSASLEVVDNDGLTCLRNFQTIFEPLPNSLASAPASWVRPCRDQHPVTLRYSFRVWLWGVIPLRPIKNSTILDTSSQAGPPEV